ncbi:ATP-dependent protease ATPase subunit HslU [Granulicella mallensis]|uniref:ATP-dependent HslUV protease ATP-binding subunit HslU n=1 Tax=Granulicella mallensis TaxID=940614 RepID=A0A7W7ZNE5_9BACT|nr:ATP-dependent protease ATPase subunit HslU [Granulicella mallensis]MBB5063165.1 ATP-dependent HslUV protease ATP-binding subunit HslU [Granulicella mallensis]
MAIYLPGTAEDQALALDEMTPREIVAELDKYVVGQAAAKRAVAIALRNRSRRQKLPPELAEEIMPKNILMIGSTGVGKTEIARRLAKLTNSPFLKIEASKFTEVGYVGRDVESMVRDLVEIGIDMVREEKLDEIEDRAELAAEDRLVDLLVQQGSPSTPATETGPPVPRLVVATSEEQLPPEVIEMALHLSGQKPPVAEGAPNASPALAVVPKTDAERAREKDRLRQQFREGRLDDRMVEIETRDRNMPQIEFISNQPPEDMDSSGMKEMLSGMFGQRTRKRPMKVVEAFDYLVQEEEGRLLDMDQVTRLAIERVEDSGMVFLDEIDKIAGREGGHGPDISREGVQRDILPIVEGTTVNTKYGMVATDHILFIAAGAFHVSKPSDLIPELQGRFPIRVELQPLTVADFLRILTEPRASLVKQATALLETEGLTLEFAPEALEEMANFAFQVNETTENIGARRLHTIMEKVLDEISFQAPDLVKSTEPVAGAKPVPTLLERTTDKGTQRVLRVEREYVQQQVADIVKNQDLSRYIL